MTNPNKKSKSKNEKHGEWHLNTSWHVEDTTYERIQNNEDRDIME
jgi:hypothetical protein